MIREYHCRRLEKPPSIDGRLEGAWEALAWTSDFVDITGEPELEPRFRTRAKIGWDSHHLYIGAELQEPHVWATITERNSVMFHDNDFEVFLDPAGKGRHYYELEINALGTLWELSLDKPYSEGGTPRLANLPGLQSAVSVRGTLNDPSDRDLGWSVTLALPWCDLEQFCSGQKCPPQLGDVWRLNFSRVQWRHQVRDGQYVRIPPHGSDLGSSLNPEEQQHPEDNWVWSPQGEINMHRPSRWGRLVFAE